MAMSKGQKRVRISAMANGKTLKTPTAKVPSSLKVPIYTVEGAEGMRMGFRQEMLSIGEGSVATGTGLGTDYVLLTWGDRQAVLRGSEILRAWVKTFAPKDAARFPKEIRELEGGK